MEDNKLKEIPESIQKLKNLRILNLKDNYTLHVLPSLGCFEQLEELDISNTEIKSLSEDIFI